MYDRPEIASETDAFWAHLAEEIRACGLDAPGALNRDIPARRLWADPGLVLGQTCGLPYVKALQGRAGLVGTPAYALEGCRPGWYRSALVVHAGDDAATLADLRGAVPAINARDSQSGYAALMHATAEYARDGTFFAAPILTGAHTASAEAVASGRARIAALDAVSWALMQRYDGVAQQLRVIDWTAPTPGLPLITGRPRNAGLLAEAVETAIATLESRVREALLLEGFARLVPEDYALLRTRLEAAHACHRMPAPMGEGGLAPLQPG